MVRAVLSVLIGWGLFVLSIILLFRLAGYDIHVRPDNEFAIVCIVWGVISAGICGYIAGIISGVESTAVGSVVGLAIAIGSIISAFRHYGMSALWVPFSALFLMAPSAAIGGYLACLHLRSRGFARRKAVR